MFWVICCFFFWYSGTDDDLPPSHQSRYQRSGRPAGNGRPSVLNSAPLSRVHSDMETQIHLIEQEAYSSILRAFKAQSDAITWVLILLLLFITNSSNKRLISFDFVHCHSSIVNE